MSRRVILTAAAIVFCASDVNAGVIFSDDFDNINSGQWTLTARVGARGRNRPGFDFGRALHFEGSGSRTATTIALDVSFGGNVSFDFRGGNEDIDGTRFWEDVDAGENGVFEYSLDGNNFVVIDTLDLVQFRDDTPATTWLRYTAGIPQAARSTSTRFRWRQIQHSGWGWDHWAIDNVVIASPEPSVSILIGLAAMTLIRIRRRRAAGIGGPLRFRSLTPAMTLVLNCLPGRPAAAPVVRSSPAAAHQPLRACKRPRIPDGDLFGPFSRRRRLPHSSRSGTGDTRGIRGGTAAPSSPPDRL